uniref:Peptidase S8/S53 domain-containing protein n=1 Tax=Solanum lycopersicum TaxID=4081 RepID=A0A3Q7EIV2_SOLLC
MTRMDFSVMRVRAWLDPVFSRVGGENLKVNHSVVGCYYMASVPFSSQNKLEALKKSPGFVSAHKDGTIELHTTHTPEFLNLNPSSGLWPASNFGQDVIIGIVDTGIWPESPSFRDDAENTHVNLTTFSARDSWGHGTHIASIASGNYVQGDSYFGYGKGTAKGGCSPC